mmetsp:Transcript_22137/g.52116  ORF Transcript_22137/g.52116 Transcript_22137/m.52116 type:complete len:433 (+) Transcript_22137:1277-2575(+)
MQGLQNGKGQGSRLQLVFSITRVPSGPATRFGFLVRRRFLHGQINSFPRESLTIHPTLSMISLVAKMRNVLGTRKMANCPGQFVEFLFGIDLRKPTHHARSVNANIGTRQFMNLVQNLFLVVLKPQQRGPLAGQERLNRQDSAGCPILFRHAGIPQQHVNVVPHYISRRHEHLLRSQSAHTEITRRHFGSQPRQNGFEQSLQLPGIGLDKMIAVSGRGRMARHGNDKAILRQNGVRQPTLQALKRRVGHPPARRVGGLVVAANRHGKSATAFFQTGRVVVKTVLMFAVPVFVENGFHGAFRQGQRFRQKLPEILLVHLPGGGGELVHVAIGKLLVKVVLGSRICLVVHQGPRAMVFVEGVQVVSCQVGCGARKIRFGIVRRGLFLSGRSGLVALNGLSVHDEADGVGGRCRRGRGCILFHQLSSSSVDNVGG